MAEGSADFYQRKIKRLEEDLEILQEELHKVRLRLRDAEDFEIKYQILLKTTEAEIYKLQDQQTQIDRTLLEETVQGKIQQNDQLWQERVRELQAQLREESDKRIGALQYELVSATSKLKELTYRQEETQLFEFKLKKTEKENQSLIDQLQQMKRYYEKQKESEISSLRAHLNTNFREKLSNQRNASENKINGLQRKIIEMDISDVLVDEPVNNINSQLTEIKERYEQRIKTLSNQLQQFHSLIVKKNQEIKALLIEKSKVFQRNRSQTQNLTKTIKELEGQMLQKQRGHQLQLGQVVKRTKEAVETQLAEYILQIKSLTQDIADKDKTMLQNTLNHDREIKLLLSSFQQERIRIGEARKELENQIKMLRQQIYEKEEIKARSQAQRLVQNLTKISRKQIQIEEYQNGVTFLQRQLKKAQSIVQDKTVTINKLKQQILQLQLINDRQLSELNQAIRQQIKKNHQKVSQLQSQIKQLQRNLQQKQREKLHTQKITKQEMEDIQSKNYKLLQQIQSLEADNRRVVESKSIIQASSRKIHQKILSVQSDVNALKNRQFLDLQRQKNQFQIVYKKKEEQFLSKYDHSVQFQKQDIDNLTHRYHAAQKQTQLLTKQNQRLINLLQNDKENCTTGRYHKKIATWNLQIALSQNILDSVFGANKQNPLGQTPARRLAQIETSDIRFSDK